MNWINPFTITVLSIGLFLWGVAVYVRAHPPKKINSLYGYRTKRSMASQEAWDFAQLYSGDLMVKESKMMVIASVVWPFLIYWTCKKPKSTRKLNLFVHRLFDVDLPDICVPLC
ncbi:MAG: SdpI family protein [Bacteroidetes bacterium]|nr:SdpI family protein [Bacteroidota bacterium]